MQKNTPPPVHFKNAKVHDQIASAVAALPEGALQYNVPDSMRVGQAQRIRAVISRSLTSSIAQSMSGMPGTVVKSSVTVSDGMRASLNSDSASVDIQPLEDLSALQTFGPDGTMMWQWDVTPKVVQPADLVLSIEVSVDAPGESERSFFTVKEAVIPVKWDFGYWLQGFGAENWQWIVSTALIPLGLWLYRRFQQKQTSPRSDAS